MIRIMQMAALEFPSDLFRRKNVGTPMRAPRPKQMSCRFVRLNITLDLTDDKSFGTGTYAMFVGFLWFRIHLHIEKRLSVQERRLKQKYLVVRRRKKYLLF